MNLKRALVTIAAILLVLPFSFALTPDDVINYQVTIPHPSFVQHEGAVSIWLILAVFAFLFSILWVLSMKLPLFKDNKKPMMVFAISMSLIVIFATGIIGWIVKLIGFFSNLLIFAFFIVLAIFSYFILSSSYSAGKQMSAEAGTAASTAKAAHSKARQAETKAHHDFDVENRIIKKEERDLAKVDADVGRMSMTYGGEMNGLRNLQRILKNLVGCEDEGQIKRLKDMYARQVAALNSMITHENEELKKYYQTIQDIHTRGHELYRAEKDVGNISGRLNAAVTVKHGAGHAHGNKITNLAHRAQHAVTRQEDLIKKIEDEVTRIKEEDKKVAEHISQATHLLYNAKYAEALHLIQEAIRLKENMPKELAKLHAYDDAVGRLLGEIDAIDREINALIR